MRHGKIGDMTIQKEFWKGKKVFLTGHTGFKGSWLSIWLKHLGVELTGYSLAPPTEPALFNEANVGVGMRSIEADIRDFESLLKAVKESQPEIVIHMAAQPLVLESYKNPLETYQTNLMGTVHVLETVRLVKSVKVILNITTDKCYENKEWLWPYREDEPMGGFDPYSNSKGCSELITFAYKNSFFNPEVYQEHGVSIATARAGNVIGGGDWACNRLIPDIMRAIVKSESVVIRNPKSIRPWQHVLGPLSGYLKLIEMLYIHGKSYNGAWNFGPKQEDAREVSWIAEYVTMAWGNGAGWVKDDRTYGHEATYLKLDTSKANSLLGWSCKWDLSEALDNIVEWYKVFVAKENVELIILNQINHYSK